MREKMGLFSESLRENVVGDKCHDLMFIVNYRRLIAPNMNVFQRFKPAWMNYMA